MILFILTNKEKKKTKKFLWRNILYVGKFIKIGEKGKKGKTIPLHHNVYNIASE